MSYSFNEFNAVLSETGEWLKNELSSIRTGQASPAILDSVTVDSYGSRMPINQVGTVTLEGPRALRVSVWDKNLTKAIEKAIAEKDLGLSVSADDAGVRVFFPQVTTEQKEKFVKLAKDRLEEARIRVRKEREAVSGELQKLQKEGGLFQPTFREGSFLRSQATTLPINGYLDPNPLAQTRFLRAKPSKRKFCANLNVMGESGAHFAESMGRHAACLRGDGAGLPVHGRTELRAT